MTEYFQTRVGLAGNSQQTETLRCVTKLTICILDAMERHNYERALGLQALMLSFLEAVSKSTEVPGTAWGATIVANLEFPPAGDYQTEGSLSSQAWSSAGLLSRESANLSTSWLKGVQAAAKAREAAVAVTKATTKKG
jgi:hypothetical protein